MKWLLVLVLLAGCSNPCDEKMTREEQESGINDIRLAIVLHEDGFFNTLGSIASTLLEFDGSSGDECLDFLIGEVE